MDASGKWADLGLRNGPELLQALQERRRKPFLATRVPELDRLHDGGLRRGTFIEILGDASSGRFALALAMLAAATQAGESAALIDAGEQLDPQGAEAAGVRLARLLWIRPPSMKTALMSAELALASGFSLIALNLDGMLPGKPFAPVVWLRLARAAEDYKAILIVMAETPVGGVAADVRVKTERGGIEWRGTAPHHVWTQMTVKVTVQKRKAEWGERNGRIVFRAPETFAL